MQKKIQGNEVESQNEASMQSVLNPILRCLYFILGEMDRQGRFLSGVY